MTDLYQHPLWLIRLSMLAAQAAAMPRYQADLAVVEAGLRLAQKALA